MKNMEMTINLTPEEVDQILIDYYRIEKGYRVSIEKELNLDSRGQPQLNFYLIEYIDDNVIKNKLTESDIREVLSVYVDIYGYELLVFKYIGGIHRVGYFFDEDTQYYQGINLITKVRNIYNQKNNERIKKI